MADAPPRSTFAEYSQLYAKVLIPDIYLIPIQANKAGQIIGTSFALNDTVVKMAWAFNASRNTRFLEDCCDAEQCPDRRVFVSPTKLQSERSLKMNDYWEKAVNNT